MASLEHMIGNTSGKIKWCISRTNVQIKVLCLLGFLSLRWSNSIGNEENPSCWGDAYIYSAPGLNMKDVWCKLRMCSALSPFSFSLSLWSSFFLNMKCAIYEANAAHFLSTNLNESHVVLVRCTGFRSCKQKLSLPRNSCLQSVSSYSDICSIG